MRPAQGLTWPMTRRDQRGAQKLNAALNAVVQVGVCCVCRLSVTHPPTAPHTHATAATESLFVGLNCNASSLQPINNRTRKKRERAETLSFAICLLIEWIVGHERAPAAPQSSPHATAAPGVSLSVGHARGSPGSGWPGRGPRASGWSDKYSPVDPPNAEDRRRPSQRRRPPPPGGGPPWRRINAIFFLFTPLLYMYRIVTVQRGT